MEFYTFPRKVQSSFLSLTSRLQSSREINMDSSSEEDNVSGKSTSSIEDDEVIIIDEVNCNLSSDKNERAENVSHITLPTIQTLQSMKPGQSVATGQSDHSLVKHSKGKQKTEKIDD